MLDFSNFVDLPTVWGLLIATALLVYALLDGFDLGVGIIFPYAPSDQCRNRMLNSIAPFWDSNETWLVLAGGGLLVVFPLAYGILMPAFYIPIFLMLFSLILRGASLEFRMKAPVKHRIIWDWGFSLGSLGAALAQGAILGAFLSGVEIEGRNFSGTSFAWLTPFSVASAIGVATTYVLLGATWIIYKTDNVTAKWARTIAKRAAFYTAIMTLLAGIMIWLQATVRGSHNKLHQIAVEQPLTCLVIATSILAALLFYIIYRKLQQPIYPSSQQPPLLPHSTPCFFLLSVAGVAVSYIGMMASVYPYAVPFAYTLAEVAGSNQSLSFTLSGIAVFLPIILGYTAYSYYVFRGKSNHDSLY